MIDANEIKIVRRMCARPASGSPIVIGVYADDNNANIEAIMGPDIKYRTLGAKALDAINDKEITVLVDFWPEHEIEWMRNFDKLRFRNQVIIMLDPGQPYSERFLSRIAVLGHRPVESPPVNLRKTLNTYTSMHTNHRDARNFVLDIEAKFDLEPRSTFSGGGLESVAFFNAAGEKDQRFIVCFLFQDTAQVDILFGELV
jgi:hypothetical protein